MDHYTSDLFLRECSQLLPFSNMVDWSAIGLKSEDEIEKEKKRKMEAVEMTADDILKSVNQKVCSFITLYYFMYTIFSTEGWRNVSFPTTKCT